MTTGALDLDATPIDTDWDDLGKLWADMQAFAYANPEHKFIAADDPGIHYNPWRVARLGWCAFREDVSGTGRSEDMKTWTITIPNVRATLKPDSPIQDALKSQVGRQAMIDALRRKPSEPVKRCTQQVEDHTDHVDCAAPVLRADRCAEHLHEEVETLTQSIKDHETAIGKARARIAELTTDSG